MAKFHLAHYIPNPRLHGLKGYSEVIETVRWGLEKLGHQVSYAVNGINNSATNIIFGGQMLPIDYLRQLPPDTIIYNFEQTRGLAPDQIREEILYIAKAFRVWDYSSANLAAWNEIGCRDAKIVPVGYAPILTRINKPKVQDIDVLFFGLSGEKRLSAFHNLSNAGLSTVFISGLYGDARDKLIARSKLVLNINLYDMSRIFEIARVSYLFANKKAVVSIFEPETYIEDDIRSGIKFTDADMLVEDCIHLLEQDAERIRYEQYGFNLFSSRDIRKILGEALA
ncbi:MAG: hypothetical protein ABSB19_00835 [Methylomonas sp.]|jgi:hypothetical protein